MVSDENKTHMPNDADDTARAKVELLFREAFGERAARLFSHRFVASTMHTVRDAFADDLPSAQAEAVGFHLADWGSDAAFVVALHLFPERFTHDEIREATRRHLGTGEWEREVWVPFVTRSFSVPWCLCERKINVLSPSTPRKTTGLGISRIYTRSSGSGWSHWKRRVFYAF